MRGWALRISYVQGWDWGPGSNLQRATMRGVAALSGRLLVHIDEDRLPNIVHLWDYTFQVKCLREDDLENLLDVDRCGGGAENQRGVHCLCKALRLPGHLRTRAYSQASKMTHLFRDFFLLLP